jgi:hypothetical protein
LAPYRLYVQDEIDDNCLINDDKEMLVVSLNVGKHFVVIDAKDNEEGHDF